MLNFAYEPFQSQYNSQFYNQSNNFAQKSFHIDQVQPEALSLLSVTMSPKISIQCYCNHFENQSKQNQYTTNTYRPSQINDTTTIQYNQTNTHHNPNIQINNDRRRPYNTPAPRPQPNVTIINNTG